MPDDTALMPAASRDVADAALAGLLQPQKTLPAKLFYDEEGCRLFGHITELPEYYLTRTEHALLAVVAPRVAAALRGPAVLVEYGASDETKAGYLLRERDAAGDPVIPRLCADRRGGAGARADARAAAAAAAGSAGVRPAGRLHGRRALPAEIPRSAAAWFLSRIDDRQSRSSGGNDISCSRRAQTLGARA